MTLFENIEVVYIRLEYNKVHTTAHVTKYRNDMFDYFLYTNIYFPLLSLSSLPTLYHISLTAFCTSQSTNSVLFQYSNERVMSTITYSFSYANDILNEKIIFLNMMCDFMKLHSVFTHLLYLLFYVKGGVGKTRVF